MDEPVAARRKPDEVADLLRGLRLAVIALLSAAVTAGAVIAIGAADTEPRVNTHYGELTLIAEGH